MKDIFQGPVFDFICKERSFISDKWANHGGIIDTVNDRNLNLSRQGTDFIRKFLLETRPYSIIETGTNYGSFSYLLYETLDDFELITCDINSESKRCIDFINQNYGSSKVSFWHVDSDRMLSDLIEQGKEVDLAWLDSGHGYEGIVNELKKAKVLESKFIMIDDIFLVKSVHKAVFEFLAENTEYNFYSYSNLNDHIGSILIMQRTNE
jgi:predicted O-methyltransferase YrrM